MEWVHDIYESVSDCYEKEPTRAHENEKMIVKKKKKEELIRRTETAKEEKNWWAAD